MKAYSLINHKLTENQMKELKEVFGADEIVYPDEDLVKLWAQISTERQLDYAVIDKVVEWLENSTEGDVVVVQGEFGCTFCIVDFALKRGLVPVHAVTKRVEEETAEGEVVTKKYVFMHCCLRKYEYYEGKK